MVNVRNHQIKQTNSTYHFSNDIQVRRYLHLINITFFTDIYLDHNKALNV